MSPGCRTEPGRCPVCQARFRGAIMCPRCGADLLPLMQLAMEAWRLRSAARAALSAGEVEQALTLAEQAQAVQRTPAGEGLRTVGELLKKKSNAAGPKPEVDGEGNFPFRI